MYKSNSSSMFGEQTKRDSIPFSNSVSGDFLWLISDFVKNKSDIATLC